MGALLGAMALGELAHRGACRAWAIALLAVAAPRLFVFLGVGSRGVGRRDQRCLSFARPTLNQLRGELSPHNPGALDHSAHLLIGDVARQIFQPAIGRDHNLLRRHMW